ncbi:hypothetical protein WKK05_29170 [Nostoc sp. UHCC 0302]|uniref:hypothetical protein n=1 Tax=Nostoc sp. UHCC 0302 TaxID=3134896 RepID=UPI00311CAD9C
MTEIKIAELYSADSTAFMSDLNEVDTMSIYGGEGYVFDKSIDFFVKLFETAISAFAIYTITQIVISFDVE